MVAADNTSYQKLTQELYGKNVDLVNANKILELIRELYEIMISSSTVEEVSQKFIDVICEKLGYVDGLVVARDENNELLHATGMTHSEINSTILEMCNLSTSGIKFPLGREENALVNVYKSGKSQIVKNITNIWTPYVREEDISGMIPDFKNRIILVYPITYGKQNLGSFALIAGKSSESLTDFEKNALEKLVTVFGIAIDRIKVNLELKKAQQSELEKAKEVIKLKDEFVFIATHDLRTPVTAIRGFVDLINSEKTDFSPSVMEDFEAIQDASGRLMQLVDDLLEVARTESGTIQIDVKAVDLNKIVADTTKEVKPAADKRKILFEVDIKEQMTVMADPEKLQEVMENLLSNAVKYGRDGGKVSIKVEKGNAFVKIDVKDDGIGIPKKLHPKIFQKFFRAKQKGTEEVAGTGLGLFVVRMLIEKMKGEIGFSSEEGKGTTFSFTLPLA